MPGLTTLQIGALYFRIANLGRHRELTMAFRVAHFRGAATRTGLNDLPHPQIGAVILGPKSSFSLHSRPFSAPHPVSP